MPYIHSRSVGKPHTPLTLPSQATATGAGSKLNNHMAIVAQHLLKPLPKTKDQKTSQLTS